jgi:hypothetical protein
MSQETRKIDGLNPENKVLAVIGMVNGDRLGVFGD